MGQRRRSPKRAIVFPMFLANTEPTSLAREGVRACKFMAFSFRRVAPRVDGELELPGEQTHDDVNACRRTAFEFTYNYLCGTYARFAFAQGHRTFAPEMRRATPAAGPHPQEIS